MSLLSSKSFSQEISLVLARLVFVGVAIMPSAAVHFVAEYLREIINIRRLYLSKALYAISAFWVVVLYTSDSFIVGIYNYNWGYFPKAGIIHAIFVAYAMLAALMAIVYLWIAAKHIERTKGKTVKYYECLYVFWAFIFVTMGGSDFLHNWGLDFFPVGCVFVTLFVLFISVAIFRHNLLGITLVVQNGLFYSAIVSLLGSAYLVIVYILGTLIGDFTQAHSPYIIVGILALVSILLRPAEQKILHAIDSLFFKRPREAIEHENSVLLKELQSQDRMKSVGILAAGMAHEIKNPLTSIRTFAEYLPVKYDDPQFRSKFSSIVVAEVDRINGIVKQLLEFSKPSEPKLTEVPLAAILDDTLSLMTSDMLSRGVRLDLNIDRGLRVFADANQLKQAFLNVLLNGLQSMPNSGVLSVSATPHLRYARIDVSDTGCGIPDDQIRHIFDPFYTTKEAGSGLGMAIVHSIIQGHGGRIEVNSKVGHGTTITLYLRLASG